MGMHSVASVGEMMRARDDIAVVSTDVLVRRVVQVMVDADVESVLVVDGGQRVVGSIGDEQLIARAHARRAWSWRQLFAERDFEPDPSILDLRAGEVMLRRVVPVRRDLPLESALRLFDDHSVNVLPVVADGYLMGALFRCDLVRRIFHPMLGSADNHT